MTAVLNLFMFRDPPTETLNTHYPCSSIKNVTAPPNRWLYSSYLLGGSFCSGLEALGGLRLKNHHLLYGAQN